ncbi:hypothetical protein [Promicromonospora sukumoe]|uniref:hypothetical protein n=1 Tax=Promicromonospora sukumoe TaxID=88382 RepID=UPI00036B09E6|nr:hypothetical protein [Promicromonospora sukumoe]
MTNLSDFSADELDQILQAPGAVLRGAAVVDGEHGGIRFLREATAGGLAIRKAREHENDFVRSVALALRDKGEADAAAEAEAAANPAARVGVAAAAAATQEAAELGRPRDPEAEAAHAVELSGAVLTLLRARADEEDVAAYREWLLRIAARVAGAVRTREGGFFSRRVKVSAPEQAFLDRLAAAVGSDPVHPQG